MTNDTPLFALTYQMQTWLLGPLLKLVIPHPAIRAIFVLPCTFVHELMHLLVGLIMNGKPVTISLWRRVGQGHWVLGAFGFSNLRWYNAMFIGLAPLLAILLAMLLAPSPSGWSPQAADFKYWALAAPILAMCLPGSTNFKMAMKSWPIICMAMALLFWRLFRL